MPQIQQTGPEVVGLPLKVPAMARAALALATSDSANSSLTARTAKNNFETRVQYKFIFSRVGHTIHQSKGIQSNQVVTGDNPINNTSIWAAI